MSNRELQVESQINSFRGVNQRTEATLLDTSLVTNSRNIYFGLDGVASRIEGKRLMGILDTPIVNIFQFGESLLIQTLGTIRMISVQDMIAGQFFPPITPPDAPELIDARSTSITIKTPVAVVDAISYDVEMAVDGGVFATLQTGVTPETEYVYSGLLVDTPYHFRIRAIGTSSTQVGAVLDANTLEYVYAVSDNDPTIFMTGDQSGDRLYLD